MSFVVDVGHEYCFCLSFSLIKKKKKLSTLNMKANYIRKSSLGRPRLICQSPLKCAGQIQNGGKPEYAKGILCDVSELKSLWCLHFKESCLQGDYKLILFHCSHCLCEKLFYLQCQVRSRWVYMGY